MLRMDALAEAINPRIQHLIIMPTEKCNFRCSYCYEDFKIGKMKESVIKAVSDFIDRRVPEIDLLSISWFGGEPLLAKKIVLHLSQHAKAACESHGVKFSGAITTNGYLLDGDTFDQLQERNVRNFQITLDGLWDEHDATRKLIGGRGTFGLIKKNLDHIKTSDHDCLVNLRVHFHAGNYLTIFNLINYINEEYLVDKRFFVHLKAVENLAAHNGTSAEDLSLNNVREIRESLLLLLDRSRVLRFDEYVCYAARPNSLVVRADGGLAKCTVALNDQRNSIGSIREGGYLEINKDRLSKWFYGYESMSEWDLGCPLENLPH